MKTHDGKRSKTAGLGMLWVLGCILGLFSMWLLGATDVAESRTVQVFEPLPTSVPFRLWLPAIYKTFCSDPYEPNNSAATAYPLATGSAFDVALIANFCRGDPDDIYSIDNLATTPSTLAVDLTGVPADADLDLYLYNAQLTLIARSDAGGNGAPEQIRYSPLSAGKYYIRVYPFRVPQNGDTRWYNLRVRLN